MVFDVLVLVILLLWCDVDGKAALCISLCDGDIGTVIIAAMSKDGMMMAICMTLDDSSISIMMVGGPGVGLP